MNLARLLLRIDARRPASWMTLLTASGAVWLLAVNPATPAAIIAAWAIGACLAVAAIGGPLPPPAGGVIGANVWTSHRLAWPALGTLLGTVAAGVGTAGADVALGAGRDVALGAGRDVALGAGGMLAVLAGVAATGNVVDVVRRRGGSPADAASFALLLAGAAALAVWLARRGRGDAPLSLLCLIVVAWGTMVAVALWVDRRRDPAEGAPAVRLPAGGDRLAGPLRRLLYRAGMAAALGGMVGWLFLVPEDARLDGWLSLGCFVVLAVPAALLAEVRHDPAWRRLVRSAAAVAPAGRLGRLVRGADPAFAVPSTWMHAAILGWPPLVAVVLSAGSPRRAVSALEVTAVVVAAALVLRILEAAASRPRIAADTMLALALLLAIAATLVGAGVWRPPAVPGVGAAARERPGGFSPSTPLA